MKVSCIIPCFNECERIGKVLEQVIKIPSIDEIICVDDGSTDGTAAFVKKKFPQVKVIRYSQNGGKSAAVKRGLRDAKGTYILLVDADLRNFDHNEVDRAVRKTIEKKADMVILRRVKALWTMKLVRGDILVSGDRILKKVDLEKILWTKVDNYQLEFAINKYMDDNKKHVFWMPTSALNTFKFAKNGFVKGWAEMIVVTVDILLFLGLKDYLKQLFFFCRRELV